jgi:hypothetical protein
VDERGRPLRRRGGTGTLTIADGGLVTVGGNMGIGTTGTVHLDGGTLDLQGNNISFGSGSEAFNFLDGTLRNVGTFDSSLNQQGGRLEIGASAGSTTISGNYTVTGSATLAIELGGLEAGTQHDRLIVTGDASLGGTLAISLIDDFEPQLGDEFTILTAAGVDGHFGAVTGHQIGPDRSLAALYDSDAVRLVTAIPGDANLDGAVTIADLGILAANWQQEGRSWVDGDFSGTGIVWASSPGTGRRA